MSCIGCEYDSFVMWGNKKVPYCKYFRQIKLGDESLCGREKQHEYYLQKSNEDNHKSIDIDKHEINSFVVQKKEENKEK